VRGEADGEILFHPDEGVVTAIRTVFQRFAETGSARRVWLWLRDQAYKFPPKCILLPRSVGLRPATMLSTSCSHLPETICRPSVDPGSDRPHTGRDTRAGCEEVRQKRPLVGCPRDPAFTLVLAGSCPPIR
jgi:hypothetical protein